MSNTDDLHTALQNMASAFDNYVDERPGAGEDLPMAFGAFLHERAGWTGEVVNHSTGEVVGTRRSPQKEPS